MSSRMIRLFNITALVSLLAAGGPSRADSLNCSDLFSLSVQSHVNTAYQISLSRDFADRDLLSQTVVAKTEWSKVGWGWGPHPRLYPKVDAPEGYNRTQWMRDRVIVTAEKFIGLPYQHSHIPEMGGLDCSNFTAWVYNYGLGIEINSNVEKQAESAGRKLGDSEPLQAGDLIFLWSRDHTRISHVVIFIDEKHIIDSEGPGVKVRILGIKRRARIAWARRIVDE